MNKGICSSNYPKESFDSFPSDKRKGDGELTGSALVIVLAFLVIVTGMVMAFFSSITNEQIGAKAEATSITDHNLADSVANIIISQLRDATVGYAHNADGSLNSNSPLCWASQPGLIRTFDTNAAPYVAYKLYSARSDLFTGTVTVSSDLPSSGWTSSPSAYTDLNAPVISQGNTNYPILDPYMTNRSNGASLVDGFSISNAPVLAGVSNQAAMPVLWLYVLKDGTILAPDSNSVTSATFANAAKQPSKANPIVSRIAYWTDDETCKLNINTASEGAFWATPSFSTSKDVAMGLFPPAAHEFNRYPGHPASTSLSPVLWSYLGLASPQQILEALPTTASSYNAVSGTMTPVISSMATNYYQTVLSNISPRYAWGGSKAGSASVLNSVSGIPTNGPITSLGTNRLYGSVDEFFFAATNTATPARRVNPLGLFQARDVSRLRFFLTADSRSPEVNPLNQPKLALWPVPASGHTMTANPFSAPAASNRTITDKIIAFCSTLGTNAYYFTRYDATSATNDMSGRNQVLYSFLRKSLDSPIPGFIGSFTSSGKWSGGSSSLQADQISTLLFDYIRSCINLSDSSTITNVASMTTASFSNSYTTPPAITGTSTNLTNGTGQVVPIVITNPDGKVTRGLGRFPTIRGASLWFIARAANQPPLMVHTNGRPMVYDPTGTTLLSASDGSMTSWTDVITEFLGLATAKVNPMHPWTCPPSSSLVHQLTTTVTFSILGFPISIPVPVFAGVNSYSTSITNPLPDFSQLYPLFDLSGANSPGSSPTRTYPTLDSTSGQYLTTAQPNAYFFSNSFASFPNPIVLATNATLTTASGFTLSTTPGAASGIVTHSGLRFLSVQRATGATAGAFDVPNPFYKDSTLLQPYQTRIEMLYIPDFVDVAPGQVGLKPKFGFQATGLSGFAVNGTPLLFPPNPAGLSAPGLLFQSNSASLMNYWLYDLGLQLSLNAETNSLFSTNVLISSTNTFSFTGGTIQNILNGPGGTAAQSLAISFPNATFPTPKLPVAYRLVGYGSVNTLFQNYPPISAKIYTGSSGQSSNALVGDTNTGDIVSTWMLTFNKADPMLSNPASSQVTPFSIKNHSRMTEAISDSIQSYLIATEMGTSETNSSDPSYPWTLAGLNRMSADTVQSVDLTYGDPRMIACLSNVPSTFFTPNTLYGNSTQVSVNGWPTMIRSAHSLRSGSLPMNGAFLGTLQCTNWSGGTGANSYFYPPAMNGYSPNGPFNSLIGSVAGVGTNLFGHTPGRSGPFYYSYDGEFSHPYASADCNFGNSTFFSLWSRGGDFDNGIGFFSDGPFIGKVDEGFGATNSTIYYNNPYFSLSLQPIGTNMFSPNRLVPSSVVMGSLPVGFANLSSTTTPSPAILTNSWLTLQYSANPASLSSTLRDQRSALAGYNEAGSLITNTILPDHLLLDFFQMPVVDPYPISDPFSTAGKVNMNYQIAPFSYINRDAALRGVLKSVLLTAVDDQWGYDYKLRNNTQYSLSTSQYYSDTVTRVSSQSYNGFGSNSGNFYFHYPIHPDQTLLQFQQRFANGDIFHSPSEICSLWLYPAQQPTGTNSLVNTNSLVAWDSANSNIKAWWYANPGTSRKGMTGDNVRERPYSYIYPRLTTKSNTYTVHYRVQVLQQAASKRLTSSDWQQWNEATDKIIGDQRGSTMIERYIDPEDPALPDFAGLKDASGITLPAGDPQLVMDRYYRYRIVSTKIFTP